MIQQQFGKQIQENLNQAGVKPNPAAHLKGFEKEVSQWIREHPVMGVGIALGLGLGLGVLFKRIL